MVLKYKFVNILFLIWKAYLFLLILIIGAMMWFEFDRFFVIGLSIIYLLNVLPGVYLHVEYWHANCNLEYDIIDNQITIRTGNLSETFQGDELEKITVYMCAGMFVKSSITYFAMEEFCFARIITKSGRELIVTNLLTNKLEEAILLLKDVPYERRKMFFCNLSSR